MTVLPIPLVVLSAFLSAIRDTLEPCRPPVPIRELGALPVPVLVPLVPVRLRLPTHLLEIALLEPLTVPLALRFVTKTSLEPFPQLVLLVPGLPQELVPSSVANLALLCPPLLTLVLEIVKRILRVAPLAHLCVMLDFQELLLVIINISG